MSDFFARLKGWALIIKWAVADAWNRITGGPDAQ